MNVRRMRTTRSGDATVRPQEQQNKSGINGCEQEKLAIKKLGRPTPHINLTQLAKTRTRQFTRKFNLDTYTRYKWLCGCDVRHALFCFPCVLFGGEYSWTRSGMVDLNHLSERIKKHETSALHVKNNLRLVILDRPRVGSKPGSAALTEAYPHLREVENYLEKTTLATPDRDSNPDLLVIGSQVFYESDAIDHAATKAVHTGHLFRYFFLLFSHFLYIMSKRGKYKTLSLQEKRTLLSRIESGIPLKDIVNEFGIGKSTFYDIKNNRIWHQETKPKYRITGNDIIGTVVGSCRQHPAGVKFIELSKNIPER
uniref:TTF-type domain-containing protein n=1 Tax=Timema tahoe TaxID=61484 RepID=A0A7R9IQG6_9NEOP|nr:unnamed protein product [Timema tahoe]